MNYFPLILLGIGIAVAGGRIGLGALLYLTVAAVAGFAAIAVNRAFFSPLAAEFQRMTSPRNAGVISFTILTLVPLVSTGYMGRKLIVMLKIGDISPMVNAILGAGFALTIYGAAVAI